MNLFDSRRTLLFGTTSEPGGGSSEAAGRRAARIGDGFAASNEVGWQGFRDEMVALGKPDPGPGRGALMTATYLAENVEAGWEELTPYLLHETNAYANWLDRNVMVGPYATTTAEGVRQSGNYRAVTPEDLIEELGPLGPAAHVFLHPLAGGIPPETVWKSLHLYENVLDALA